ICNGIGKRVRTEKLQVKTSCKTNESFTVHFFIQPCHEIPIWHIIKNKLSQPVHWIKPSRNIIKGSHKCRKAMLRIDITSYIYFSVIKISSKVCHTILSRYGGGKITHSSTD